MTDNAGYSLKDLFIGSEGTLGVITQVLLKLIPKPATKKTLVATYSRMDSAAQTVSGTLSATLGAGETVYVSLDNGSTWVAATTSGMSWSLAGQTLTASNTGNTVPW